MTSAILFIGNQNELELSKAYLFEKHLIDYTVSELKRLDIEVIYLVGDIDYEIKDVVKRDNLDEAINEVKDKEGKSLLISPFYPLIEKEDYEKLLKKDCNAVFVDEETEIVKVYSINNDSLSELDLKDVEAVKLDDYKCKKYEGIKDISFFQDHIKEKVNNKWLERGVIISDPKNTIIGVDVVIDKNTVIYPNTVIEGKCLIGKNNVVSSGVFMINTTIGDNNAIGNSANISNSIIHNRVKVNAHAVIDGNSEIFDDVKIGNLVKINSSKLGKGSSVEPLSFLGNLDIGEDVKIGAGVVSVNNDGRSTYTSTIKSHSIIGSNATLISPVVIGEYALVGAGSTIDQDIKDGDMAISRLYQQNKKGYGYKHIKED